MDEMNEKERLFLGIGSTPKVVWREKPDGQYRVLTGKEKYGSLFVGGDAWSPDGASSDARANARSVIEPSEELELYWFDTAPVEVIKKLGARALEERRGKNEKVLSRYTGPDADKYEYYVGADYKKEVERLRREIEEMSLPD